MVMIPRVMEFRGKMAKKALTYPEKLKDPRWQRLRLIKLELAGWACERCGDKEQTLHVHHAYYEWGKEPWDYDHYSLSVLCEDCHSEAEWYKSWFKKFLASEPLDFQASIYNIVLTAGTYTTNTQQQIAESLESILINAGRGDGKAVKQAVESLLRLAQLDGHGECNSPA